MKKQIVTTVLGAVIMAITATAVFAMNGNAVGGGAAGGPNGIYKDPYGANGNNTYAVTSHQRKQH